MQPSLVRGLHWVRGYTLTDIDRCLIPALFAAVFIAGGSTVAHAAAPAWAAECAALDDDAARLSCYDSHNPRPPKAAVTQPSTASSASSNDFGLESQPRREPAKTKAAEVPDLVAQVASVSERLTGELLLKLDNGQSWAQAQRKPGVLIKAGERVSISRGALGGYLLRSDSGASMRVRRLE